MKMREEQKKYDAFLSIIIKEVYYFKKSLDKALTKYQRFKGF